MRIDNICERLNCKNSQSQNNSVLQQFLALISEIPPLPSSPALAIVTYSHADCAALRTCTLQHYWL